MIYCNSDVPNIPKYPYGYYVICQKYLNIYIVIMDFFFWAEGLLKKTRWISPPPAITA